MVFIYASLALIAWTLICLLTYKPLTTDHYGYDARQWSVRNIQAKYAKSEETYRAARTIQAIVGVVTIPLTSAVCSAAAVVYAQSKKTAPNLTIRQTMTLADKGWTDPTTIFQLISGRGRQYSSSFLVWALLLNVLGASITPLQTIFLSQRTIKTPSGSYTRSLSTAYGIVDIPDKLDRSGSSAYASLYTMLTRNVLKSASNTTPQPRLWHESTSCLSANRSHTEPCVYDTKTLGNFSQMSNPYLAQLPVGYHTGLIRQFIPRINSTVKWDVVSPEDMPANCGVMPDSFYTVYANATAASQNFIQSSLHTRRSWSIEACMPDFSEVLFLNISVIGYEDGFVSPTSNKDPPSTGGIFRITSNTTAGYFELPNYMNGGQAGPIITGDPDKDDHCGFDCDDQAYRHDKVARQTVPPVSNYESTGSKNLASAPNRGPLLTVATALFGYDSFIAARLDNQQNFIKALDSYPKKSDGTADHSLEYIRTCVDQKPLSSLLLDSTKSTSTDCIKKTVGSADELDIDLAQYIMSFYLPGDYSALEQDPKRSGNAFAAAVFLANEAWLTSDNNFASRHVESDPGVDMVIPAISRAGIILISSLWAIYIVCLFSLALYSAKTPRWTYQLDAFAMMRIGAAAHDKIDLKVGFKDKTISALDEMPGFVGDATGGEGDIGSLGLGATTPLNGIRRIECYKGDASSALWKGHPY